MRLVFCRVDQLAFIDLFKWMGVVVVMNFSQVVFGGDGEIGG